MNKKVSIAGVMATAIAGLLYALLIFNISGKSFTLLGEPSHFIVFWKIRIDSLAHWISSFVLIIFGLQFMKHLRPFFKTLGFGLFGLFLPYCFQPDPSVIIGIIGGLVIVFYLLHLLDLRFE